MLSLLELSILPNQSRSDLIIWSRFKFCGFCSQKELYRKISSFFWGDQKRPTKERFLWLILLIKEYQAHAHIRLDVVGDTGSDGPSTFNYYYYSSPPPPPVAMIQATDFTRHTYAHEPWTLLDWTGLLMMRLLLQRANLKRRQRVNTCG